MEQDRQKRLEALKEELEAEAKKEDTAKELSEGAEIFRLARELGLLLKADRRMQALEGAKAAYLSDEGLQKLLTEYDVQQRALANLVSDAEHDETLVGMVQNRINELYERILENEVFRTLTDAQEKANALMDSVNNTIAFTVTGQMPACTHDCSTCGGSCHE